MSASRHTDLAEAQKDIDNLHAALTSQPVIERAKGILMAHHNCGPDRAWLLADASQRQNRKLRDVAAAVVASVQAPPGDWPSHPIVIEARGRRRR